MDVKRIVIHHSASDPKTTTRDVIASWHKAQGWKDIGYHCVIEWDGQAIPGRGGNAPGAHVRGHNEGSLGICVVGNNLIRGMEWTLVQKEVLVEIVNTLLLFYPEAKILRHCDLAETACPGLTPEEWEALQERWNYLPGN